MADKVSEYLASSTAVCEHLADQLLLPMAIAGGGRFTTLRPTRHMVTNIGIVESFLPVSISIENGREELWTVTVERH